MYDIDKENIFWREDILNIIKGKPSKEMPLNDRLLEMERDILLHPRNIHHLLMPLTNDIFVGELYNKEFVNKKYIKPDKDDLISILNPSLNVKKAIIFVKGKFAVGIGAKGITFHVLNQINTASPHIGEFLNLDPKAEKPKYLSTKLRFDGVEGNRFGNYVDTDGNLTSEIMSQLLTMYVDGVKEPYAVLMNITMQTANTVDYLIKAGLSARDITFFLSQPLIKDYLLSQKSNESLFIKNSKKEILITPEKGKPYTKIVSRELSKNELLSQVAGRFYDKDANFGILDLPANWKVSNLEEGLKLGTTGYANKDFYKNQMYMLQHFLEIQELSKAYGNFTKTQDSDTRGFADIQDIIEDRRVRAMVEQQGMVDLTDVYDMTGLVSPFYKYGRKSYENLFEQFYSLLNSNNRFSTPLIFTKNNFAEIESALNKDKVMSTLDNDFMVFLVQNLYFNQDDFIKLTSGEDSVAKRVKKLKQTNPSNLFLKNLQPIISKVQDPISGKRLDQVRLYEKQLDGLSTNEISKAFEEIYELDPQLYEDLIHLNFFQNGFNKGIFNYLNAVPTGRLGSDEHLLVVNKIQTEVINKLKEINQQEDLVKELFAKFVKLFDRNNLQFVPKNRIRNGHTLLKRNYYNGQSTVLAYFDTDKRQDEDGKAIKPVPVLNNRNFKRYHIGFLQSKNNVTDKDLLNQAFNDSPIPSSSTTSTEYTNSFTYEGVTIPTEFKLGEQQEQALISLINYLTSNTLTPITLSGAAGTGKTTIIGYVQKYLEAKNQKVSFVYSAPTHAATAELAVATAKLNNRQLPLTVASLVRKDKIKDTWLLTSKARKRIIYSPIIVVDESSMLSPEEVDGLEIASRNEGAKLIFMGDIAQIQKVVKNANVKNVSTAFTKYKVIPLTKIYRQSESGLLNLLQTIRNRNSYSPLVIDNTSQLQYVNNSSEFNMLAYNSFKEDPQNTKIITYSNDNVAQYNNKIRTMLGFTGSPKVGEVIVGYGGYNNKQIDGGHLANSISYKITNIEKVGEGYLISSMSDKLQELQDLGLNIPDKTAFIYLPLSRQDSLLFDGITEKDFKESQNTLTKIFRDINDLLIQYKNSNFKAFYLLDEIESLAKQLADYNVGNDYIYNPTTDKMELYRYEKHRLIDDKLKLGKGVDYGYAITVHKSQGATIKNVFFDPSLINTADNIKIMQDGKQINTEANSLYYVGMSRGKSKTYVLNSTSSSSKFTASDFEGTVIGELTDKGLITAAFEQPITDAIQKSIDKC